VYTELGGSEVNVMSRPSLTTQVDELYCATVGTVIKKLEDARHLCLTADAWSAHSRAFLGVTCHWITGDFKRESAVLACSRFPGTHSYDRIALELNKVISKFKIQKEKIVCIVTDNGSNFVKAFKEFGISANIEEKEVDNDSDESYEEDEGNESDSNQSNLEEAVVEIDNILHNRASLELPRHFKCASHTLSLIATKDILEVRLLN